MRIAITGGKSFGFGDDASITAKEHAGCDLLPGVMALSLNLGQLISRGDPEALNAESRAEQGSRDQRVVEGLFQFVAIDD